MGKRLENATSLYLEAIRDGDAEAAINQYSGARYTQHSTPVKDGREGFIEFFADFIDRNPIRDIEILRSFEDGQYVFLHVLQTLNNGEFRYVTADIFDTDDDAKLIEHWDIIAEVVPHTVSGHSQIDGTADITDLDKTAANKALVADYVDVVLTGRNHERLGDFVSEAHYVEHNPTSGDGLHALRSTLQSTTYQRTDKLIGSGNLVAALSEVDVAGTAMAVIDLFRIDGDKIVEHWEVTEEITPKATWVNSGKF